MRAARMLDLRRGRAIVRLLAVAVPSLAVATALVWLLEDVLGVPNASIVYIVAVVATALGSGTVGALVAAVSGIALYDYLFTQPVHTLVIEDPDEWLSIVLLLFVGLVVGELTALQRDRAEVARAREREARELFRVSRALATRQSTPAVLAEIAATLQAAIGARGVWINLGRDDASERIAADATAPTAATGRTQPGAGGGAAVERRAVPAGSYDVLRRAPGDEPARWVRVHPPAGPRARSIALNRSDRPTALRVRIEVGDLALGSIWVEQDPGLPAFDPTATRLLAAAADQVGQALAQDRLAAEAQVAEVSRQSDTLKSALLQSVSHDLRTPLAAIRAAAGTLRPDSGLSTVDRQASADAIEREVERLDRLVANLLDLSRIEAGALRAEREVFELDDIVGRIVDRLRPRFGQHQLDVTLPPAAIVADPVFLDEVVTNLLENAAKFTPAGGHVAVIGAPQPEGGRVRLTVEDSGPGVGAAALERIFEKFYRDPATSRDGRPGTGIGLAVVRGLADAMGAAVGARPSRLGGLAVDVDLPAATLPVELDGSTKPVGATT